MIRRPPRSTLFPYTRSSDLVSCRSGVHTRAGIAVGEIRRPQQPRFMRHEFQNFPDSKDRKSTRLNSSHLVISYAVFCLKKKNQPFLSTTLFLIGGMYVPQTT